MNCGARLGFCCDRQVIHDNGGQLPVDEVSSLMSFLLRLIADPVTPGRRQPFRSSAGSDSAVWVRHMDDDMEVQRLAYVAIGVIFSRAGPAISNTTWKSTVEVWFAIFAHDIYPFNFLSLDFDCNLLSSGEVIILGFSISYIVDHQKSLHNLRVIMSLYKQHHSSGLLGLIQIHMHR